MIDKEKSLAYFKTLHESYSIKYYKKQMYAIKKFLQFLKIDWINDIILPQDPEYSPRRITFEDISQTIEYFREKEHFKRHRALILLGYTNRKIGKIHIYPLKR